MSLSLIPVFDPKKGGHAPESGEVLGSEFFQIEEFTKTHRLPSLNDFADQREIPEDFDGSPEDLEELLGPCTDWFDAETGEKIIRQIATEISSAPDAASTFEDPDSVVKELTAIADSLHDAAKTKTKFRLEFV